MQTIAESSAKTALLSALIDDASLFPPATLEMQHALRAHVRNRESAYAHLQGRFVIPASRLGEWRAHRDPAIPMRLGIIFDGALAGDLAAVAALMTQPSLTLDSIDVRAAGAVDLAPFAQEWDGAALSIWIEAPFEGGWVTPPQRTLAAVADMRAAAPAHVQVGAKLRCGGPSANFFPTLDDLAAFIIAAQSCGVPWKATAGLHHPIRHRRPQTNFPMHGFLNVACAALARYADVTDDAGVRAILAEEDPRAFSLDPQHLQCREWSIPCEAIVAGRVQAFTSYGSCSFFEPVDDLRRLGMLA